MNKELEDRLIKQFPFYTKYINPFHFECDDGWFDLLDEMSAKIQEVIDKENFDFTVSQIKEKYGSLRYYTLGSLPEIDDIIDEYEEKSQYICETCGKPGKIENIGGWLKCLCSECFEKIKNEIETYRESIIKGFNMNTEEAQKTIDNFKKEEK